jgi:hypothetical protein
MNKQTIRVAIGVRRYRPAAPVLTANNAAMSLDWIYNGPPCAGFHVFQHLPGDAAGVFKDNKQVPGDKRTCALELDDPTDALGYKFYVVPEDDDGKALAPPSNIVTFAAG